MMCNAMKPTPLLFTLTFLLAFLSFQTSASAALTVRVDASQGAPRLVVNGRPVRARMFYGSYGSYRLPPPAPLPVPAGAHTLRFDFTARATEPGQATLHFRFGQAPGEIDLDDIHVTDLNTHQDVMPTRTFEGGAAEFARDWAVWPEGAANTVGTVRVEPGVGEGGSAGLHISIKAPANGAWPDFHVHSSETLALTKGHHYRVSFWIRADAPRSLTVAFYRPGSPFVYLGGVSQPDVFSAQIKMAARAGVPFVSFMISPIPWPAPGQPADWSEADDACDAVLRADPSALLVPRISVNAPDWWRRAHAGEMMRWEDSPAGDHPPVAVPASPAFRRDAGARLAALIAHVEGKYGDHMGGYHVAGQNTDEWFYQDSWGHALNGYAPADLTAWRLWLKQHYGTSAALQAAWNDPGVTPETAAVPTPAARHAAPNGLFRDPQRERAIIDFNLYQQQMMADCVCDLAHVARVASGGRKLVLFFYGYGFELSVVPTGPGSSGHYSLRRVLDCPDIDVLCSPISYYDRGPDGSAPTMTTAESVALAGKMKLNEDDTATYLSLGDAPGADVRVRTRAETNEELTRNVAQEALRNFGTWWMDLGATGWFNDAGLWDRMARLNALDQPLLRHPTPYHPPVAAVLDERTMLRLAEGAALVTGPAVSESRRPLGLMGASYGQYLLDDVAAGRVPAQVYVFLNAWVLSAQQRTALARATRGRTRVWCYTPGLYDDDYLSPAAMRALTGFALRPAAPQKAMATPTARGRALGLTRPFGLGRSLPLLFTPADAKLGEILATYPDGSPAVALRRSADGVSLFVGVPGLTPELLRLAARAGGVHLYTQTDCNVCANGPFLVVHAAQPGPVQIDTGKAGPVRDVLSGRVIGQGPHLSLNLARGETRVLILSPALRADPPLGGKGG